MPQKLSKYGPMATLETQSVKNAFSLSSQEESHDFKSVAINKSLFAASLESFGHIFAEVATVDHVSSFCSKTSLTYSIRQCDRKVAPDVTFFLGICLGSRTKWIVYCFQFELISPKGVRLSSHCVSTVFHLDDGEGNIVLVLV